MIIVLPLLRNAQAKEQDAGGQEQVTGKAILFSVTPTDYDLLGVVTDLRPFCD